MQTPGHLKDQELGTVSCNDTVGKLQLGDNNWILGRVIRPGGEDGPKGAGKKRASQEAVPPTRQEFPDLKLSSKSREKRQLPHTWLHRSKGS